MCIHEFKASSKKIKVKKKKKKHKHKHKLTKSLKTHTSKQSTHQLIPFAGSQILLP